MLLQYNEMEYFSPNTCNIIGSMILVEGADIKTLVGDGIYMVQSLSSVASSFVMVTTFSHNLAPILIGQSAALCSILYKGMLCILQQLCLSPQSIPQL